MGDDERRVCNFYSFCFPEEFFRFRDYLAQLPPGLLAEACDLCPAYPFDLADGRPAATHPERPEWEDRYYHDLPEFVTLFTGTTDGLHHGYYFDDPGVLPPVVPHYWHSDTFEHAVGGDGLFEAVRWELESSEHHLLEMADDDPDEADYYEEQRRSVAAARGAMAPFWGGDRPETGDDYLNAYDGPGWRRPVAPTWDQLGIVVPADLYRPLSFDPFAGHAARTERGVIEPLLAEAGRELAAGRPGAALKLGRDLWCWADEYPECYELLDTAYAALGREPLRRQLGVAREWRAHCDRDRRPTPG